MKIFTRSVLLVLMASLLVACSNTYNGKQYIEALGSEDDVIVVSLYPEYESDKYTSEEKLEIWDSVEKYIQDMDEGEWREWEEKMEEDINRGEEMSINKVC